MVNISIKDFLSRGELLNVHLNMNVSDVMKNIDLLSRVSDSYVRTDLDVDDRSWDFGCVSIEFKGGLVCGIHVSFLYSKWSGEITFGQEIPLDESLSKMDLENYLNGQNIVYDLELFLPPRYKKSGIIPKTGCPKVISFCLSEKNYQFLFTKKDQLRSFSLN